jgi:hypothetical protein
MRCAPRDPGASGLRDNQEEARSSPESYESQTVNRTAPQGSLASSGFSIGSSS